jgi:polyisoprenoid-binding protein YceI
MLIKTLVRECRLKCYKIPCGGVNTVIRACYHSLLYVKSYLLIDSNRGKTKMVTKFRTLFLLLAVINSTAAYACSDDSDDLVHEVYQQNAIDMSAVLQESLYEIQRNTSKIEFRVDSPVGDVWVSFEDFEGSFVIPKNSLECKLATVDINTESMDTDAGFIGMLLKSESFFDVENFPSIRFVGNSLEWFNPSQAVLKGDMTIQNTTRPVAFYIDLVDAGSKENPQERITVKASTTIKRSEFGIYTMLRK